MQPEAPAPELLQANALTKGGAAPPPEASAALGQIPPRSQPPAPQPVATPQPISTTPAGETIPRTLPPETAAPPRTEYPRTISGSPALSGDSVLRQILDSEPNKVQLQIARSRGIDVSQEALLKPTDAVTNRIINKIVDDFSPDELEEARAQYLEQTRIGSHDFRGDVGKEANQTINLQTYFPDLKIPLSRLLRTQKIIQAAAQPSFTPKADLAGMIKESAAANPPAAAPAAAPAATGSELEKLQAMLNLTKKGAKLKDMSAANQ